MKKIKALFSCLLITVFAMMFFPSCNGFQGNQEIPAYLHVDTFLLTTNYPIEGAASHKITDVSVYVDDDFQGYYELPATIPILEKGKHRLTLMAGIKLNGNSSTRTINPFYIPYTIEGYVFEEAVVDTVTPTTKYYPLDDSDINFRFMEDFERQVSLENTAYSDTTIIRTERDDPENWVDSYGNSHYSGYVWIGDSSNFCITTEEMNDLPNQGNSIFLELDYKCTDLFKVGLIANVGGSGEYIDLVYVNPSAKWNKIYINLGPNITDAKDAFGFKVFLSAFADKGHEAEYYFDNIKVVYRD